MSTTADTAPSILDAPTFDNRQAFADQLVELARTDERIVAVCNDSVGSSNLVAFRAEFPDRLINVGIASRTWSGWAPVWPRPGSSRSCAGRRRSSPGAAWNRSRPTWPTASIASSCAA